MVLAGDNYFGFDFKDFINAYSGNPLLAVYDIKDKNQAKQFGVVISGDGVTVDAFEEKPENPTSTLVSTGAYIFPESILSQIIIYAEEHNDDLGGIFEYLKQKEYTINIYSFLENWFDIGSFKGYLEAHKVLQEDAIMCERETDVVSSDLKGAVSVAENCVIENSVLENVILFPNTVIDNCEIRNCIIDGDSLIRDMDISYKIIRGGSWFEG